MKKSYEDYLTELREHRYALQALTTKMQGIQSQIDDLADLLNDEATSARELVDTAGSIKKSEHRIGPKHFRLLAILAEYGPMHRDHVARILGMKASSVGQLACQIRKHHLGDLKSRKGFYTLHAIGDDVRDNAEYKLI